MLGQIIMYCVFIVIFCLCCTLIPFMVKLGLYFAKIWIEKYEIKQSRKRINNFLKSWNIKLMHLKEEKNETQSND